VPEARFVLAISQCSIEQAQQVVVKKKKSCRAALLTFWCSFKGTWLLRLLLLAWSHVSGGGRRCLHGDLKEWNDEH
jgi:hypothetical protein